MQPTQPFWFKQRQAKLEPVADQTYKVTAPNQGDAYLVVRPAEGRWQVGIRATPDGADLAVTGAEFATEAEAWEAGFELYRRTLVV